VSAVEPYRVQGGIMVPKLAEGTDGTIGVLWVKLAPAAVEYATWDRYLRRTQPRGAGQQWPRQR
jgi:hypothetical protein